MQALNKYLFVIFVLIADLANAQPPQMSANSTNGVVVYRQKINLIYLDNQQDTLRFNRIKSIFRWNAANFSGDPGLQAMKKKYPNSKTSKQSIRVPARSYYGIRMNLLDTEKDSLFSLMGMKYTGKVLYVKEKAPKIRWHIQDSTKQVGNYTVKKATAHFRGRDYTAWFTPKISIPYGPWKLHGLPGLILQAYDESGDIYFSATDISFSNIDSTSSIGLDGREQVVSIGRYKKFLSHYKRFMKQQAIKQMRQLKTVSNEELAEMQFHLPAVRHMEIFEEDGK